ncbi:unnamed protein product [Alopecurus aequalis]
MAPVVSAALGAFGPLLGKLANLLANECGRLKGVRREIRSLKSELTSMHGALTKYTKLENPDDQVKEWISLVRELAYDTEDCFDKFTHHLGDGRQDGGFREFVRKTARRLKKLRARRGIASRISDLKIRIKEVKDLKSSYKLDDTACSTSSHVASDPRLSALFAEEAHLVGVDGPRDDLAKWMKKEGNSSNTHHPRVLSIVGFGGLGKTTLANAVYRKVQGQFNCHAFVSVSQKPDTEKIIKDLISQVSLHNTFTKDIDMWDEKKSIAMLRELLHDKRYLIIIDDIWSLSAWDAIKCGFPENNCSSRIIATTRILEVAQSCCPGGDDHIYIMPPLSNINSEKLFFRRIFGSEDYCPDMLRQVSSAILKKCGGLPLAIISISSLLTHKPRLIEEWERVKRSIGSAMNNSQSLKGMKNILYLSYNDLQPNLKTCLLYLSIFPEDCVIGRKKLVRRWIAEGFISGDSGLSCEEVAEKYFYELINKSMVQPVDIGCDGKVHACRVHDIMLELIISKSIEENFITVINGRQTVWENSECLIRRLSIQHIDQDIASVLKKKDLSHVRSLTVTSSSCIKHLPCLDQFETLRVLDFEDCKGLEEYDLCSIDKLFQMKYLSFRNTDIINLPSGVLKLQDLETLDLRDTFIEELPAGIIQLVRLQHLLTGDIYRMVDTNIPIGIGNMINLREVSRFDITISSVDAVEELGNLINLKVLRVCYMQEDRESNKYKIYEEMLLSSLCKLGTYKLQSLCLYNGTSSLFKLLDSWSPLPCCLQSFEMDDKCGLSKLPKWIAPALTSLAYLRISLTSVNMEDFCMLGELPALHSLKLYTHIARYGRFHVKGKGFLCLKEFDYILVQENKESATVPFGTSGNLLFEKGSMPKLEKLTLPFFIKRAPLYDLYIGIEHLPCLKNVLFTIVREGEEYSVCKAAAVAIKKEAAPHPNHPRLTFRGQSGDFLSYDLLNQEEVGVRAAGSV